MIGVENMNLETKLNAREIVGEAGMSARPEFYSGRGAINCDLNDKKLESIYQTIKREYSEGAAQYFAQMVADIPKLTATDFLLTLYRLEAQNWKWNKNLLGDEKGIDVGPDQGDGKREITGMMTVLSILGGLSERDETEYIRSAFLKRHGIKNTKKEECGYNGYFW